MNNCLVVLCIYILQQFILSDFLELIIVIKVADYLHLRHHLIQMIIIAVIELTFHKMGNIIKIYEILFKGNGVHVFVQLYLNRHVSNISLLLNTNSTGLEIRKG